MGVALFGSMLKPWGYLQLLRSTAGRTKNTVKIRACVSLIINAKESFIMTSILPRRIGQFHNFMKSMKFVIPLIPFHEKKNSFSVIKQEVHFTKYD